MSKGNTEAIIADELQTELTRQEVEATAKEKAGEVNKIEVTFTKTNNKYILDRSNGKIDEDGKSSVEIEKPPTPPVEEKVEVGKKVETTKKDNYKDNDGDTATVPKDFAIVPGCDDISEGLVISDVENDTENTGNQFVWVPVDPSKFQRIEGFNNKSVQTMLKKCSEPYASGYENEASEYQEMYNHVTEYEGFYIGRYEAGKDSSRNVIVKKGADVYNNVPWGNAMNDITGTSNTSGKVGAVKLSKNFAESNGYTDVTSTLCYGIQWDAVMNFMDSNYSNGVYNEDSYVKDSTNKGWYEDNYNSTTNGNTVTNPNYKTGIDLIYSASPTVIANKQKNIYDMAGNMIEWTMEAYDTSNRVYRGGSYDKDGLERPASRRINNNVIIYTNTIGFRITMYM